MINYKIYPFGASQVGVGTKAWLRIEFQKQLDKFKAEKSQVFVYSGLEEGVDLICAELALDMRIPIFACIPYDGFNSKYSRQSLKVYQRIRSSLFSLKVIAREPSYECYRQRVMYLVHQSNVAFIGRTQSKIEAKEQLPLIQKMWTSGNMLFDYNLDTKQMAQSLI